MGQVIFRKGANWVKKYDERAAEKTERIKKRFAENHAVRDKKIQIKEKGLYGMGSKKGFVF